MWPATPKPWGAGADIRKWATDRWTEGSVRSRLFTMGRSPRLPLLLLALLLPASASPTFTISNGVRPRSAHGSPRGPLTHCPSHHLHCPFAPPLPADTWTEASAAAKWTPRSVPQTSGSFVGNTWLVGGYDGKQALNDVWSSADAGGAPPFSALCGRVVLCVVLCVSACPRDSWLAEMCCDTCSCASPSPCSVLEYDTPGDPLPSATGLCSVRLRCGPVCHGRRYPLVTVP